VLLHLLKATPRRKQRGEELGDVTRNSVDGLTDGRNFVGEKMIGRDSRTAIESGPPISFESGPSG
jgi:hypothetical protein